MMDVYWIVLELFYLYIEVYNEVEWKFCTIISLYFLSISL